MPTSCEKVCIPRSTACDSTDKFAAALASLTRLYEEVNAKVETYGGDIDELKKAIEKEVADRIAADEALRADLLTVVTEKISVEESARESADEALAKRLDELAGSEIGGMLDRLNEEVAARREADEKLDSRIDNEIKERVAESTEIKSDVASVKAKTDELSSFYERVDAAEDKVEVLQKSVTEEIQTRAREVARLDEKNKVLEGRIDTLESGSEDVSAKIAEEKNARISGDNELSKKIDETKEACQDYANGVGQKVHDKLTADLAKEAYYRDEADKDILSQIGASNNKLVSQITTETDNRKAEDEKLKASIETIKASGDKEVADRKEAIDGIKSEYATKLALSLEETARRKGDEDIKREIAILDNSLQAEVKRSTSAENAINANMGRVQDALIEKIANEKQDRIDGDDALDARVRVLESKTPASGVDLDKEREERIAADDAEREARELADNTAKGAIDGLDNRLSDEVARRTMEDNKIWDAINSGIKVDSTGSSDYSSFYVWANGITVPTGKVSEMSEDIQAELVKVYGRRVKNVSVAEEIAPGMTHSFSFRTIVIPEDLDIVVDWGDGTKTTLVDEKWDDSNHTFYHPYDDIDEHDYKVTHTYSAAGKYLVKILGRQYFGYRHAKENNLVSHPFAAGAHIASFIKNMASTYENSNRMLVLDVSYLYPIRDVGNMAGTFQDCKNLHTLISLGSPVTPSYLGSTFRGCTNLTVNDSPGLGSMRGNESISYIYYNCSKLKADIADIITSKARVDSLTVDLAFGNCSSLYGTVPSQYLWDDATVNWKMSYSYDAAHSNKQGPFYGCSDEIRAQVPLAWGGTNRDIIVRPYDPIVATSTDISFSYANAAVKMASVSAEIKSLIEGLARRVTELEESGSGGTPRDSIYMTYINSTFELHVVNADGDPTIDIKSASGHSADAIDRLYFYGSDGKKYIVRIAMLDGEPTLSVERATETGDSSITTGIKFYCPDDDALYVMKVVKPVGDEAAIALVPFGS